MTGGGHNRFAPWRPRGEQEVGVSPGAVERSVRLSQQPDSPALARRFVGRVLQMCERLEWCSSAELAVTELVTNAVLHAHTEVVLRVRGDAEVLHVEVEDFNARQPVPSPHRPDSSTGRGMALVALLTHAHGVIPTDGGKIVWFTITDAPIAERELGTDDLLADWADLDMLADAPPQAPHVAKAVLRAFPSTLWLAAVAQHDALLRELALYRAGVGRGVEDLAAADRARTSITDALHQALRDARAAGRVRSPLPPGHPAPLDEVPPVLDLTVPRHTAAPEDFVVLQDVLDEAQRLAAAGQLLIAPALPEIVAVRNWAAEQMIAAGVGLDPRPWPGTDDAYLACALDAAPDTADYAPDAVLSGEDMVVLVDGHNRIVGISPRLAEDLGWFVDDLVGRRVVAIVPPAYRDAHIAGFTRHLATGEAHALGVELQLPVLTAEGSERPYIFFIEADRTAAGLPFYIARLRRSDDRTSDTLRS